MGLALAVSGNGDRRWPLIAVLTVLANACGTPSLREESSLVEVHNGTAGIWQDREQPPLNFTLDQSFGTQPLSDPKALLSRVIDVDVDIEGNVLVLDADRIVKYGPNGDVRWVRATVGSGPGDLHEPRGIALSGVNRIYIGNLSGTRIDVWSTEGRFLDSMSLERLGLPVSSVVGFMGNATLVLGHYVPSRIATAIVLIDVTSPWTVIRRLTVSASPPVGLPPSLASSINVSTTRGSLLAGNKGGYQLRELSAEGHPMRVITKATIFPLRPAYGDRSLVGLGAVHAPLPLEGGYWLGYAWWVKDFDDPDTVFRTIPSTAAAIYDLMLRVEYACSLDLIGPDGTLLYSWSWNNRKEPPMGVPWLVSSDNALYTVSDDPETHVRRYTISTAF